MSTAYIQRELPSTNDEAISFFPRSLRNPHQSILLLNDTTVATVTRAAYKGEDGVIKQDTLLFYNPATGGSRTIVDHTLIAKELFSEKQWEQGIRSLVDRVRGISEYDSYNPLIVGSTGRFNDLTFLDQEQRYAAAISQGFTTDYKDWQGVSDRGWGYSCKRPKRSNLTIYNVKEGTAIDIDLSALFNRHKLDHLRERWYDVNDREEANRLAQEEYEKEKNETLNRISNAANSLNRQDAQFPLNKAIVKPAEHIYELRKGRRKITKDGIEYIPLDACVFKMPGDAPYVVNDARILGFDHTNDELYVELHHDTYYGDQREVFAFAIENGKVCSSRVLGYKVEYEKPRKGRLDFLKGLDATPFGKRIFTLPDLEVTPRTYINGHGLIEPNTSGTNANLEAEWNNKGAFISEGNEYLIRMLAEQSLPLASDGGECLFKSATKTWYRHSPVMDYMRWKEQDRSS
jgi:hypothetical protein